MDNDGKRNVLQITTLTITHALWDKIKTYILNMQIYVNGDIFRSFYFIFLRFTLYHNGINTVQKVPVFQQLNRFSGNSIGNNLCGSARQ